MTLPLFSFLGLRIADWYNLNYSDVKNTPAEKTNDNYDFVKEITPIPNDPEFECFVGGSIKYQMDSRWTDDPNYINDCLVNFFEKASLISLGIYDRVHTYYSRFFKNSVSESIWTNLNNMTINLSPFVLRGMLKFKWIPSKYEAYIPESDIKTISPKFVWERFYSLKKIDRLDYDENKQKELLKNMSIYGEVIKQIVAGNLTEKQIDEISPYIVFLKNQRKELMDYL